MPLPNTPAELARFIDLTLSRADATAKDIEVLCAAAREHSFAAVCVNPCRVALARHLLDDSEVKVAALVGFPLGASDPDTKRFETEAAIDNGAQEIDFVLNFGLLKDGDDKAVLRELRDVVEAADERPVKAILEIGLLSREQIIRACPRVLDSGAQFIVASGGFGEGLVRVEDVRLLRECVGPEFAIKAAGAMGDAAAALALIEAGASRLGIDAGSAVVQGFTFLDVNRPIARD